jgi:hypothetical protein
MSKLLLLLLLLLLPPAVCPCNGTGMHSAS